MLPAQPDSYRKTQIESAPPEVLILMLYDGALRFMGQAEEGFAQKNNEKINNNLVRVQAIISELLTSLDKEKGGDIAKNLERLYVYFLGRLTDANVNKDLAPVLEVKPMIEDLRNTWAEAMKVAAKNKQSPTLTPTSRLNISA